MGDSRGRLDVGYRGVGFYQAWSRWAFLINIGSLLETVVFLAQATAGDDKREQAAVRELRAGRPATSAGLKWWADGSSQRAVAVERAGQPLPASWREAKLDLC